MLDVKWVFNNTNNEEDSWGMSDFYDSREECIKKPKSILESVLARTTPYLLEGVNLYLSQM